jgi:hypothetical protein
MKTGKKPQIRAESNNHMTDIYEKKEDKKGRNELPK